VKERPISEVTKDKTAVHIEASKDLMRGIFEFSEIEL